MIDRRQTRRLPLRSTLRRLKNRRALTLLEVLLAASILVMVMSALAQLQDSGVRAATRAEIESEAIIVCQSEMDRLLSQPIPPTDSSETVTSAPEWTRRVRISPAAATGLTCVTIELIRTSSAPSNAVRPVVSLSRWFAAPVASSPSQIAGGVR